MEVAAHWQLATLEDQVSQARATLVAMVSVMPVVALAVAVAVAVR